MQQISIAYFHDLSIFTHILFDNCFSNVHFSFLLFFSFVVATNAICLHTNWLNLLLIQKKIKQNQKPIKIIRRVIWKQLKRVPILPLHGAIWVACSTLKVKSGWQFITLKKPSHWIQTFWMPTSIWEMFSRRHASLIGKFSFTLSPLFEFNSILIRFIIQQYTKRITWC